VAAGLSRLASLFRQTIPVMPLLVEKSIHCPYCGERINILIDDSVAQQSYIEDCQVCCRPIVLNVTCNNGEITLSAAHENE
jgi:hypothetical protein